MMTNLKQIAALALATSVIVGVDPQSAVAGPQHDARGQSDIRTLSIPLDEGSYLQILAPDSREGAEAARNEFYSFVFPQAAPLGLARHGQLAVDASLAGGYEPGAFVFLTWKDKDGFDRFVARPDWPAIKRLRQEGWEELQIFSSVIENPAELKFRSDKFYTVAVVWASNEDPGGYDRYMDGIQGPVAEAGGKFLYKMRAPDFEAHDAKAKGPLQLTIVEWNTREGLRALQQSEAYRKQLIHFRSGTSRVEFYRVSPTFPT